MKKLSIILLGALVLSSCSKNFFDINQNPNASTNASVDLVLANAQTVTASRLIVAGNFQTITEWMNYWCPSGSYALSSSDGASYKETTDFGDGNWQASYRNLEDYDYVEKTATATNNYFYIGAAKAMKAFVYQQLVDQFNNIPYSEALQGTGNLTPKYDNAQSVYDDLEKQLKAAIVYFKRADAVGSTTQDVLFSGNNSRWIQFCNSLRLRMLIRQSQIGRGAYIQAEINDIVANGGGFLTTDAAVNPGYTNSTGKQNPFYGFCINTAGTYTQDFWRANKYIITFCTANNDPRYTFWYAPNSAGNYIGCVVGFNTNPVGSVASVFGPGLLQSVSQSAVVFTASESYQLQAEAALKGWLPGNAQTYFNNGVQAAFNYLGAGSMANAYYTQNNKQTNYGVCATDAERLACIIRQKYLGFHTTTPVEAWSDYRRLGLPADLPLSVHNQIDRQPPAIPIRLLYATSEYVTNPTNVPTGIDYHTSKIFWMP